MKAEKMPIKQESSNKFDLLRQQAEALLQDRPEVASRAPSDMLELVHELGIHQAELEIQNEELRRAQMELSELHHEYEKLYEFAPFGYVTVSSKGIITRVNLTGVKLLGAVRQQLLQSRFTGFVAGDWEDRFLAARIKAGATGEKQSLELALKSKTGFPLWVWMDIEADRSETGAVVQWRMAMVDITQKKSAEELLLANEARLRLALEASKAGIWEWDLKTNKDVWSDTLYRLYDLDPQHHKPSYESWLQSVVPEDRAKLGNSVQAAVGYGNDFDIAWRVNTADGSKRWLMSRGVPQRDATGRIVKYMGVAMTSPIKLRQRRRSTNSTKDSWSGPSWRSNKPRISGNLQRICPWPRTASVSALPEFCTTIFSKSWPI